MQPESFRPNLAASLTNISTLLRTLGRQDEALAAAREAVELYRALAAVQPQTFRANLTSSLTNLSTLLNELDRHNEAHIAAREAAEIRRAVPLQLFISYAHKDKRLQQELEMHLSPLKRQGIIEVWSEWQIDSGQEWEQSIRTKLETADIILLLISPDFLSSDFCFGAEIKRAMERHQIGEARVIPVFLRPCYWQGEAFEKLQGVPYNAKPISQWHNRDKAFHDVVNYISEVANQLRQAAPPPPDRLT